MKPYVGRENILGRTLWRKSEKNHEIKKREHKEKRRKNGRGIGMVKDNIRHATFPL